MASITLLLLSISTRQMKNANKTDNDKCTLPLLRRAVSSVSFSVFSRSTHTLVVMAVRAESELLKAAAIMPIVKVPIRIVPDNLGLQTWVVYHHSWLAVRVASVPLALSIEFPGIEKGNLAE